MKKEAEYKFQKGNKFWQIRSKHGMDKLFASPELMWEAACEYFQWCDDNPQIEIDFKGKDIEKVQIPHQRPYTLHGLCSYIGCVTSYFRAFKSQTKAGNRKNGIDFVTVIGKIEETIYNQQFSGAASGFLNPNIIARNLGLSEKTENTHKVNMFDDTDAELIKQSIAKLRDAVS